MRIQRRPLLVAAWLLAAGCGKPAPDEPTGDSSATVDSGGVDTAATDPEHTGGVDSGIDSPVDTDPGDTDDVGDTAPVVLDQDGDGWSSDRGDCDDDDPEVHPGAEEVCGDGVDNNCNDDQDGCGLYGVLEISEGGDDVRVYGVERYGLVGSAVDGAGDVDGDGFQDVIIGATEVGTSGAAYVVYGPLSRDRPITEHGFALTSGVEGEFAGAAVSGAGDVDGDGYGDVLIGAPERTTYANYDGAAYLFLGPITADRGLEEADRIFYGSETSDHAGCGLDGAGDINGDGLADLIIGA